MATERQSCLCGCGDYPQESGSKFLPRHDGKLAGILHEIEHGSFPGTVIPPVLLQYARTNLDGSTAGYSHRKILDLSGSLPRIEKRLDKLDKLDSMDEKLDVIIMTLNTMLMVLQRIEGNTRPPGRNGGGDGDPSC